MSPARVMLNTAAVLVVVGLAWLLIQVRSILVILILSVLLAAAIEPLVYRLRRHGFRRGQAILTIYAGILLTLIVSLYLVVPTMITQATEFFDAIPEILDDLQAQALANQNDFIRTSGYRTLIRVESAYLEFRANPTIEGQTAIGWFTTVIGFLFATGPSSNAWSSASSHSTIAIERTPSGTRSSCASAAGRGASSC
jgi:predicted PurR-regulated permease PerM